MPAEVMLMGMRHYAGKFARAKNLAPDPSDEAAVAAKQRLEDHYADKMVNAAAEAAPYFHPKFAVIKMLDTPNPGDDANVVDVLDYQDLTELTPEQLLEQYRRAIAAPSKAQ